MHLLIMETKKKKIDNGFMLTFLLKFHIFFQFFRYSSENSDADESLFRFLAQTNTRCEWLWSFFFKYVMAGYCGSLAVASVGSILFCFIFIGQVESDYLFSPYRLM